MLPSRRAKFQRRIPRYARLACLPKKCALERQMSGYPTYQELEAIQGKALSLKLKDLLAVAVDMLCRITYHFMS
jgi:hypothetical protein